MTERLIKLLDGLTDDLKEAKEEVEVIFDYRVCEIGYIDKEDSIIQSCKSLLKLFKRIGV